MAETITFSEDPEDIQVQEPIVFDETPEVSQDTITFDETPDETPSSEPIIFDETPEPEVQEPGILDSIGNTILGGVETFLGEGTAAALKSDFETILGNNEQITEFATKIGRGAISSSPVSIALKLAEDSFERPEEVPQSLRTIQEVLGSTGEFVVEQGTPANVLLNFTAGKLLVGGAKLAKPALKLAKDLSVRGGNVAVGVTKSVAKKALSKTPTSVKKLGSKAIDRINKSAEKIEQALKGPSARKDMWIPLQNELKEASENASTLDKQALGILDEAIDAGNDDMIAAIVNTNPIAEKLFGNAVKKAVKRVSDQGIVERITTRNLAQREVKTAQTIIEERKLSARKLSKIKSLPAHQKSLEDFRLSEAADGTTTHDLTKIEHREEVISALDNNEIISREALEEHPELFRRFLKGEFKTIKKTKVKGKTVREVSTPQIRSQDDIVSELVSKPPKTLAPQSGNVETSVSSEGKNAISWDRLNTEDLVLPGVDTEGIEFLGKSFSKTFKGAKAKRTAVKSVVKRLKEGLKNSIRLVKKIEKGKAGKGSVKKTTNVGKAFLRALSPSRLLNQLDGSSAGNGIFKRFLYDTVDKEQTNKILRLGKRKTRLENIRINRGIDSVDLEKTVTLSSGNTYTKNELMTMTHALEDEAFRKALISKNGNDIPIDDLILASKALTADEKGLINEVRRVTGEAVDDLSKLLNDEFDLDFRPVKGAYHSMQRLGENIGAEDNLLSEANRRAGIKIQKAGGGKVKARVARGKTIPRKNIPIEGQTPVNMDFYTVAMNTIEQQEHLLAFKSLTSNISSVLGNAELQASIRKKIGKGGLEEVTKFIEDVANPNRVYGGNPFLTKMRKNTALYYLSYNLNTILKQGPSLFLHSANSDFRILVKNTLKTGKEFQAMKKFVFDLDPQVSSRVLDRDLATKMAKQNPEAWKRLVKKFGETGMRGIMGMDERVVVSGWDAVYRTARRKGMSHASAIKEAHATFIASQPQGNVKDLPGFFRGSEVERALTQFGSQLSQNLGTIVDAVGDAKRGDKQQAIVKAMAVLTSGLTVWGVGNGLTPPTTPDEAAEALLTVPLSMIPLIGSTLVSGSKGFAGGDLPMLSVLRPLGGVIGGSVRGDPQQVAANAARVAALMTGFAGGSIERAANGIVDLVEGNTNDVRRLLVSKSALGEKKPKKKTKQQRLIEALS